MCIARFDLDRCVGCRNCISICPMDVFRFDEEQNKSVIAYPENCQNCGQCYLNCTGRSLVLTYDTFGYTLSASRYPSNDVKRYQSAVPDPVSADE
ncbi:ferredoxin family protein [bacterium]|nr:ferredoxin family protein [bacterium]